MANLLVTGKWGEAHVSSSQARNYNAAIVGSGQYVFSGFECSIEDANTAHIGGGVAHFNGADVELPAAGEDVTIENGSQGMQRIDVVCLVYTMSEEDSTENVSLQVIKGNPAATNPQQPTIPDTNILDGDNPSYMPLWSIPINGITVGTPVKMFVTRGNMADLSNLGITATASELNFVDGVTANIQTQLNTKATTTTTNALSTRITALENAARISGSWQIITLGNLVIQAGSVNVRQVNINAMQGSATLPVPVSVASVSANIPPNNNTAAVLDWIPRAQIVGSRIDAVVHSKSGTMVSGATQTVSVIVVGIKA